MPTKLKGQQRWSTADVSQWFTDATLRRRRQPPTSEACEKFANDLALIGRGSDGAEPRLLADSARHAKGFLKEAPLARKNILAKISDFERRGVFFGKSVYDEMLNNIAAAESSLEALLKRGDDPVFKKTWHLKAMQVCKAAIDAWRSSGKAPSAVNPNDPLCKLVHAALAEIGINQSLEAVSDALRMKRGPLSKKKGKTQI